MNYRLNMGIMIMSRLIPNWPDSPVTVMVLSDTSKNIVNVTGVEPVINSKTTINVYGRMNTEVTSNSKHFENWYKPHFKEHPEEVERRVDMLHHLDFTGYCFKEKVGGEDSLPTLIVVSNDVIVDRTRWESVSLDYVKSNVLKTNLPDFLQDK